MFDPVLQLPVWGYVLYALVLTHITIASVTIYLHRHQAHRALSLHPLAAHFFRFWLWLTTATVTREWIAVHRKHHANVESEGDPHSPQVEGIHRVLWLGSVLYHRAAADPHTLEKYGHGAPNDRVERWLYTPCAYLGVALMLAINIVLLGPLVGFLVWLTQMLWIPFWAAGVINGIGHFLGYRNYELQDSSRNIIPWGILIGGEELHNNHHAYATSAKFSSRKWEIDLGWIYIRALERCGLARVRRKAPQLIADPVKKHCDLDTVRVYRAGHIQIAANFARQVMSCTYLDELRKLRRESGDAWRTVKNARHLILKEVQSLDEAGYRHLRQVLDLCPRIARVHAMRERLNEIWNRNHSADNLLHALEDWCATAEASGIQALHDFATTLKGYRLEPLPTQDSRT